MSAAAAVVGGDDVPHQTTEPQTCPSQTQTCNGHAYTTCTHIRVPRFCDFRIQRLLRTFLGQLHTFGKTFKYTASLH